MKFKKIDDYPSGQCFFVAMRQLGQKLTVEAPPHGLLLYEILFLFNFKYNSNYRYTDFETDVHRLKSLEHTDLKGKTGVLLLRDLTKGHVCAIIDGVIYDKAKPNKDTKVVGILECPK